MQKIVTLKGTKEGFQLLVDQAASFSTVVEETTKLINPLKKEATAKKPIELTVKTGNRLWDDKEKETITTVIEEKSHLKVKAIESEVVKTEKAIAWHEEVSTKLEITTVRSGQIIEAEGDLLLVGGVHPGGTVKATGSIFIIGDHRGIAHAGTKGKEQAVVVANFTYNAQVRIADHVHVIDTAENELNDLSAKFEVVYLDDLHILRVSPLNELKKIRPELGNVTGGLING
ncbi:septum site-determining protein MinC [Marinilactibacillus kalidii]|uniref:septum site-determining protein MinC n=1 Tax=Marinilactibacillus kalidii TaxID=2820274 RepID=UPI001FCA287D|nr:septum site-determining protein MinC [Marinilactibacillus kalidii]